jgi:hypothetical protein
MTEVGRSGSLSRVRCSDLERQHVVTILGSGLGQGRLTIAEFDHRAGAAYAARHRSDLDALVADLPFEPSGPPTTSQAAWLAIARLALIQLCVDTNRLFRDVVGELRVGRCAGAVVVAAVLLITGLHAVHVLIDAVDNPHPHH